MSLYFQNYTYVLKKNYMLVIMSSMLLLLTFFIWAGVPVFVIGSAVSDVTANFVIVHLCMSLTGGFLFSLYFVPINVKVAAHRANLKQTNVVRPFVYIQTMWIIVSSIIFGIGLNLVIRLG
ncbi:hypothetical protein [Ferdinandcohnia sp. Marseille-Q9671]